MTGAVNREDFSRRIFDRLADAGVTLFSYVPDFGNDELVKMAEADNRTTAVLLSSEEEGVALCAGADLVGARGVLLMQSSGVGNCPNMLSLVRGGRFPMLMIVTMTLSDVLNNVATALIAAPIAVDVAGKLGVSPDPFLMAVAVAASCAFLTPIGHKNNTIIMGPGGYQFGDYWRMGLPLELIVVVVGVPALLVFWPL